ncbi:hypothetical protein ACWGH4_00530 [Streptomyces sp. NPDC054847]
MMKPSELEPSAYDQLLNALGDSEQSRTLINQFAHELADLARLAEASQWPGPVSQVVDPFGHTRESWAAATGCARLATPDPEKPVGEVRTTVEFFVQTEQPDGTWEQSSSAETDAYWAADRQRKLMQRFADMKHRIVQRTATVRVVPLPAREPIALPAAEQNEAGR